MVSVSAGFNYMTINVNNNSWKVVVFVVIAVVQCVSHIDTNDKSNCNDC